MKLKEFSIIRYGPLSNVDPRPLHSFNLFWGKNEDGKTLTIDALVKFLLGKKLKKFKFNHIDRVEEEPEGYIVLEDSQGNEFKIPEKGRLTDLTELTPSVCRNIFIIRESDLRIEPENKFYTDVTDRLTGSRTERISRIKKELKDLGKLTRPDSQSSLSNSQDYDYISTRLEKADALVQKIGELQEEMKKEEFDQIEKHYVQEKEKLGKVEKELEDLEKAEKRGKYEKGSKALEKLKMDRKEIMDLENYVDEGQEVWRDKQRIIQELSEKKKELKDSAVQKEKDLQALEEEIENIKREFNLLEEKKNYVQHQDIKEKMTEYEKNDQKVLKREPKSKYIDALGIFAGILTGISGLGVVFSPSPWFLGLAGVFLLTAVLCWGIKFNHGNEKGKQEEKLAKLRSTLSRYGLDAPSIRGMRKNIQQLEDDHRKKSGKISQLEARKNSIREGLEELEERDISKTKEEIRKAQSDIEEIKRKSGLETLDAYKNKLQRKQTLERDRENQKVLLQTFFSQKSSIEEENIPYWEEKLKELFSYKEAAKGIEYDDKKGDVLKEKRNEIIQRIEELEKRMDRFQRELDHVEEEANKILGTGEHIPCDTSLDLEEAKKKLQSFIQETHRNTHRVLQVMEIFEDIEKEEKEKVSQLFGRNSGVTEYFQQITDGLYKEVSLNPETGEVEVKRKDGKILKAPKLSAGAYDQLYFSIRLCLGEKLLKNEKGFFIMDDPFLKADWERLKRLLETLKKICGMGWQILYFTAKQEVRDALCQDLQNQSIKEMEIRLW